MMKQFLVGVCTLILALPAVADVKIGVIDTGKAFDAFYKTQDSAKRIAVKENKYRQEIQQLQSEYQQSSQEAETLANAVKNSALPQAARKEKDSALALKVQDLKSMEDELNAMSKQRAQEIHDELKRSHEEISEEIVRVIRAYASKGNYDLVIDYSVDSPTIDLGRLPYRSAKVFDITESIIRLLNAKAPPA